MERRGAVSTSRLAASRPSSPMYRARWIGWSVPRRTRPDLWSAMGSVSTIIALQARVGARPFRQTGTRLCGSCSGESAMFVRHSRSFIFANHGMSRLLPAIRFRHSPGDDGHRFAARATPRSGSDEKLMANRRSVNAFELIRSSSLDAILWCIQTIVGPFFVHSEPFCHAAAWSRPHSLDRAVLRNDRA